MQTVKVNFDAKNGAIKPMHSVNNGPINSRNISNEELYAQAGIPYARNHDAAFCANYGGSHTVDIPSIFPNFDADVNDPASYDFTLTDMYLTRIANTGTKVFYRLGVKIEHEPKKYGIIAPKDPFKWAQICEHVIRHYNEGWADGLHMGIEYWEIWNEPDLHGLCWVGTDEQFFELYETTATHLKFCFPHLKIGGPAVCGLNPDYLKRFFDWMTRDGKRVPMDFFSWHRYTCDPRSIAEGAETARALLERYGYTETESILDEWNYIRNWEPAEEMKYNYRVMTKWMKGAAFIAASMQVGQDAPLDHMMYYDARPCGYNGLFADYTLEPLRGYYSICFFNHLYRLGQAAACETSCDELYATAAEGEDGEKALLLTYYADDDSAVDMPVRLEVSGLPLDAVLTYEQLDRRHPSKSSGQLSLEEGACELILEPQTVILFRYK